MNFVMFSTAHLAGIGISVLFVAVIIAFRRWLRIPARDRAARYGLALLLVASEISMYTWYTITDGWGWYALPFQLCTITLWLSVILLVTKSRKIYEVVFFLGTLGALQAIVTPYLNVTFPAFRYFHFFIAHAAIVTASVYLTAVIGYRPTFGSVLRAMLWLNLLAVPAFIANKLTGQNFMFLAHKPETKSLLDLLAPWPWYIVQLEIVAFGLCLALLGIMKAIDRYSE